MTESGRAPGESTPDAKPPDAPAPGAAFPVVGVGASAGGLEPLTQLLRALPVDTGMAFVIVQHLAPDHASSLTEILARATRMTVCEVSGDCGEPEVEADHVYVIPPGRDLVLAGGRLRLLPQERAARPRGIDHFFRSLAEDCGHKAIGVVLSGAMNDGTLGLEAIKAGGGITFAQNDSAQHDSMPRSAVASGCVDFVLSPAEIAGKIARIARHPYVAPEPGALVAGAEPVAADLTGHDRIVQILQDATGVDFSHYKASTLHRRITRRMVLHTLDTLKEYEAHLRQVPDEVTALFQDILINVTSFFRDPAAFEALAHTVFPRLLEGRAREDTLRIWTVGCSTGEEAYSLAMAYTEYAEAAGSAVPVQIFATDLNPVGVGKARTGFFAKGMVRDVSPERLRRFFTEEADGYRIGKAIRERCIFSRHNVLADPPFSRVDLVSCRNLLIYLEPVLQQQVMPLLHYALKPGGYLWLGSSETTGASRALFDVVDARNKIFVRRAGGPPSPHRFRPASRSGAAEPFSKTMPAPFKSPRADLPKEAERILLTKYAPPGVVISAGMEVLQYRGDTGAYLAPMAGAASLHLLKMLREGLLVGVRAAILRAGEEGRTVREEGLRVKREGGFRNVTVEVVPLQAGTTKENGFLVLFEEAPTGKTEPAAAAAGSERPAAPGGEEVTRLTQELAATHEYLQSVIEQQDAANEELQLSNEEAQSANEEMQSVNEELETSKEEIQSSNEELATVNDELNHRNLDLSRVNASLQVARDYAESVVASGRSPLVVLDAALRVKKASIVFYETFQVAPPATEGRLIYDLGNGQWNIPALRTLLEELLPQQEVIDNFEVRHTFEQIGPRIMLINARRLPQAPGNEPLIVLAIEDITERTRSAEKLIESERRFRFMAESMPQKIFTATPSGAVDYFNAQWLEFTGLTFEQIKDWGWTRFIHPDDVEESVRRWRHSVDTGEPFELQHRFRRADGTYRWHLSRASPMRNPAGEISMWLGSNTDFDDIKHVEESLAQRTEELARADRRKDEFLAMLAHELRNPLAPLRNAAKILAADDLDAGERKQAQDILGRQIENMTRMIDDLLDVARITEGKIVLRRQPVALADILNAAVSVARPGLQARNQALALALPAEPVFLDADATRLEQVFGNLLTNACKYSDCDGHIWLTAERAPGAGGAPEVIVRVRDDGIGLAPELLPRVFDLFVQATRALDRAHGGLGIGLTLVQRLVKLHGGSVGVHSEGLGCGSEFTVRLPILAVPPPSLPPPSRERPSRERPRRILVVDDNEDSARSMALLQRRRGHETRTAFTGPSALATAAVFLPEVVLLDIGLPGMNGYEVARRLRALPGLADVFVVAISGYGRDEDRAEARRAGINEYLVKPVNLTRVSELLQNRP